MRWLLAFSLIVAIDGWRVYHHYQRTLSTGQLPWMRDLGVPGPKSEIKIDSLQDMPLARCPAWVLKNTLAVSYVMLLADMLGAVGCVVAHHKWRGAWRWFGASLFLFAAVKMAIVVVFLDRPVSNWFEFVMAMLYVPPESGYLMTVLFFDWWFPSRQALESADNLAERE